MTVEAPMGYRIDGDYDALNEADVLELCIKLSSDPNYLEIVKKASHQDRVDMLLENGFEIYDDNGDLVETSDQVIEEMKKNG